MELVIIIILCNCSYKYQKVSLGLGNFTLIKNVFEIYILNNTSHENYNFSIFSSWSFQELLSK